MDKLLASYVETALWSSTDDDGRPLDALDCDVSTEALAIMKDDLAHFIREIGELADKYLDHPIAHDFWLTRNRHGAGFWDGDYPEPDAGTLTRIAQDFGECYLYLDDGLIYIEG